MQYSCFIIITIKETMLIINPLKKEYLTSKSHFNTWFKRNQSFKKTEPLKCDTFMPSFKGEASYINNKTLFKNGNFPELLLCRQFNKNLKDFRSVNDINKWAEKEYILLKNFDSAIFDIYHGEPKELLKKFTQDLDNPVSGENNPVKKLLLFADFFFQGDDNYIVPYNKEIFKETFKELPKLIKTKPDAKISIYKLYKNKMLNSDKMPLHTYHSGDKLAVVTDYNQPIGIAGITPEGYFFGLEVFSEYRHSKTSKRTLDMLFNKAESIAKSHNLDKIKLDVLTENKNAALGYINKQNFKVVDFDLSKVYQRMEKNLKDGILTSEELQKREASTNLYKELLLLDEQSFNEILSRTAANVENGYKITDGCDRWNLSSEGFDFIREYSQIKGL